MNRNSDKAFESTEGMSPACKQGLRDLLIACADTKLLLGYHYGEWTFGPPEIEAAIACCSLCQTELGHVRLLHGILNSHFGEDQDHLLEKRDGVEFANIAYLDNEIADWAEFVAANYVVDLGVTTLLHVMQDSTFKPLQASLGKMLQEERYHIHHGQGWFRALAQKNAESRKLIGEHVDRALTSVIAWYGPADSQEDAVLVSQGIKSISNSEVLQILLNEVGALADSLDVKLTLLERDSGKQYSAQSPDWATWNPRSRRFDGTAPDDGILYHLRGSKNKVFKLT